MSGFTCISPDQAQDILKQGDAVVVDMRDPQAYAEACIDGAVHLDNDSIAGFLNSTSRDTPVLIYCYHGISSVSAGQFLVEQGFQQVMSIDGGFEAWRQREPLA